jgi:hypothetical protein
MKLTKQLLKEMVLKEMNLMESDDLGSPDHPDYAQFPEDIRKYKARMFRRQTRQQQAQQAHKDMYKPPNFNLPAYAQEITTRMLMKSRRCIKNLKDTDFVDKECSAEWVWITAHNPPMKSQGQGYNNKKHQKDLIRALQTLGYEFTVGEGLYFGEVEESIMVFSGDAYYVEGGKFKETMMELGKRFFQDAIVYGQKFSGRALDTSKESPVALPDKTGNMKTLPYAAGFQGEEGPRYYFETDWISLHPTGERVPSKQDDFSIGGTTNFNLSGPEIQKRKDFITKMGGPASYTPLFDADNEEFIPQGYPVRRKPKKK